MYDVITIGSATRDVFVKSTALEVHLKDHSATSVEGCFPLGAKIEVDDLIPETGGGATNAAVTFGRLGLRVATVAAVGDDSPGREIRLVLEEEGVDPSLLQVHKNFKTGFSVILLAGSGERTVFVYRGAAEKLNGAAIPWRSLSAKWFYVSSIGGDLKLMRKLLDHAERRGIKVAWNPGSKEIRQGLRALTPLIRKVDLFNLNKEEAAQLVSTDPQNFAHILKSLRQLPRRALIVTDGLAGAYAAEGSATLHSAILDVPRINVTGAGDAFGSGVVAGLLKKDDIRFGLAVGTWNATGVVQQMGAKRGIMHAFPSAKAIAKVAIKPWK
ncbi:MAG TPA: carbohydrate kinase family protein [Candidatus Binatia bacterium]|nr:carbohydrate kinase family protein [Candidatus Binatia bacterium]